MRQKKLTRKQLKSINESETIETIDLDFSIDALLSRLPINIDLAGIYFVSAFINILQGKKEYKRLTREIEKYNKLYEKNFKKYPLDSEEFTTRMIPKLRNIEVFYEPVIRHFSIAKILLVCCGESYINEVAYACINGRKLQEFDKLSIIGKWLFIQDVLKLKKKFGVDSNPLQGFDTLVKERNKLVHFKGMKKIVKNMEIPNYIFDLKLGPNECENNLKSVKDLISTLTLKWRGSYGPHWLKVNETNFRNPCFYIGNKEISMVLYSEIYDKGRV